MRNMSVAAFERALLRLKAAVGARTDHDLAALLDMSSTEFNQRKKRGSFPEQQVRFLSLMRPDLGIDVAYVLTGRSTAKSYERPLGKAREALAERLEGLRAAMQSEKSAALTQLAASNRWHGAVLEALVLVEAGVLPAASLVHALRSAAKLPEPVAPSFAKLARLEARYYRMQERRP